MEKASIGRRLATAALCTCLVAMGIPAAALAQGDPSTGADAPATNDPAEGVSATEAGALAADGLAAGQGEASRSDPVLLASFEDPDPASYDVAAGEDLPNLPGSLLARDDAGGQVAVEGVSWECADADPVAPGTHVFAAVLPAGYEVAPSARLPQVTVNVAAPQAPAPELVAAAPRGASSGALGNGASGVLHVTFDDGGKMSDAIDEALEGENKGDVMDIVMAGNATEITGDDWMALKYCFKTGSDWSSLSGLDLSGMGRLKEVRGLDGGNDAFDRLTTLKLPDSLETVGAYTFFNCENLALSEIPAKVSSIGERAFSGCKNLERVSFPSGLKSVGKSAFEGCSNLKELLFGSDAPPKLGADAFKDVAVGGTVYCPDADAYETKFGADGPSGWTYASLYELQVEFNNGTAMQDAIDKALEGKDRGGAKDIVVTGDATAIAGNDWTALKDCYKDGSAWTSLSGLDLLKMDELGTVSGVDGGGAAFGRLAHVWLPDTMGSIGDYAFSGCTSLRLEYLPEGVTSVGAGAFQGCTSLALGSLVEGVRYVGESAFEGCTSLVLDRLPDSIEFIKKSAFSGCEKLDFSEIPANVLAIEPKAFSGCKNLERVSFPSGLKFVGESAFEGCSNLKELSFRSENPPKLDADAFEGVAQLGAVYCPDATAYETAFKDNGPSGWRYEPFYTLEVVFNGGDGSGTAMQAAIDAALADVGKGKIGAKDIVVTGAATEITKNDWGNLKRCYQRDSEWANLSGLDLSGMGELTAVGVDNPSIQDPYYNRLVDLKLPSGLETIDEYAFLNCDKLVLDELPSSLEAVGKNAFDGCSNLALDELPSGLTSIGAYAFNDCGNLALEELPAGVEDVPDCAFQGCISLALAKLPANLSSIGQGAFNGCKKLAISALPAKVSSVGSSAFSKCEGLKAMALPSALQSIYKYAFEGCTSLAELSFYGENPPTFGASAFEDVAVGGTVFCSNEAAYRTALQGTKLPADWAFDDLPACTLEVSFADGGDMRKAIDDALAASGKERYQVTDIRVIGDAKAIAGGNWDALKECYKDGGAWPILSSLDLSGMGGLKEVSGTDPGSDTFGELVSLALPDGLATVGPSAFQGCTSLTLGKLPDGVTAIGHHAFSGCVGLALTALPEKLGAIESGAFQGCSNLALDRLPDGIISVGERAFSDCVGLKEMSFPSDLKSVGASAFQGCSNLAALEFRGSAPSLGASVFLGVPAFGELYFPQGENYVQGDFGGDDLKGWGFYGMARRTLVDAVTGAKVSGVLSSNAGLLAQKGGLHQAGACKACDAMRKREAEGVTLAELCLSLSGGRLWGGVDVSIPVGADNDGRGVAVLHCAGDVLEEAAATVAGGYATGAFSGLSPFAVVASKPGPTPVPGPDPDPVPKPDPVPEPDPTPVPKPVPTSGSGSSAIAATGDGPGAAPWIALATVAALVAAGAAASRKRARR